MTRLSLLPISIRDANFYVARWHRHLGPKPGALFALSAYRGGIEPVGVVIVGRPNGRMLQNGVTCEVLRLAVNEADPRNVASFLYAKAKRAAQALGYRRGVTSTRVDESGASLRAVQAKPIASALGKSWDRPTRRRSTSQAQLVGKTRWLLWDNEEATA